jgi:DNA polymerase
MIEFVTRDGWLEMILPSGRSLYYAEPVAKMMETPWGEMRETLVCFAYSTMTHKWAPRKMYGGLWVENAVQAIARDILADAMLALESTGFPVVLTVHDEIVAEVSLGDARRRDEFTKRMARVPDWASGCPIEVESWEGQRYRK